MPVGAHVVWLKRDLRVHDHRPLSAAVEASQRDRVPVVVAYVYENGLRATEEWDERHDAFIEDCLDEVEASLTKMGTHLTRLHAQDAATAFDELAFRLGVTGFAGLWSHEETGGAWTFARDKRVAKWCRSTETSWREIPQHGVFRRLRDREGWARQWERRMAEPPVRAPERVPCITMLKSRWSFGMPPSGLDDLRKRWTRGGTGDSLLGRQRGGERIALELLDGFLTERGVNYRADMSSPVTGFDGCSRLSPHLAWGSISIRTVHHALRHRQAELKDTPRTARDPRWLKSLTSYQGRLRWHCHFIQKLESEPEIEFHNMHRSYDHLRQEDDAAWTDEERQRFEAWRDGRTGYPFIDACMRCLAETGWMNFRMRSMLVSFASHHLWLHWRPTAHHLGRLFTDFEPGIHYCQMQMQSATTGINTVRIYNPIKQGQDQDPDGVFTRRWVPELADVPDEHLQTPWEYLWPGDAELFSAGSAQQSAYPRPIVEHAAAYRHAQHQIFAVRKTDEARDEARRVYLKHGSRRRPSASYHGGEPGWPSVCALWGMYFARRTKRALSLSTGCTTR